MRLSDAGKALIKGIEGLRLTAYPDAGQWSIGYGHSGAYEGQTITRAQAEQLFNQDVAKYEAAVNDAVSQATPQQFDAMVSLAWNIGVAGFAGSTVARLHEAGDTLGAGNAFRMWRKSEGSVDPRLVTRRERERNLYLFGVDSPVPLDGMAPSLQLGTAWGPLAVGVAAAAAAWVLLPKIPFARHHLSLGG